MQRAVFYQVTKLYHWRETNMVILFYDWLSHFLYLDKCIIQIISPESLTSKTWIGNHHLWARHQAVPIYVRGMCPHSRMAMEHALLWKSIKIKNYYHYWKYRVNTSKDSRMRNIGRGRYEFFKFQNVNSKHFLLTIKIKLIFLKSLMNFQEGCYMAIGCYASMQPKTKQPPCIKQC
jgi:hypothetical protein